MAYPITWRTASSPFKQTVRGRGPLALACDEHEPLLASESLPWIVRISPLTTGRRQETTRIAEHRIRRSVTVFGHRRRWRNRSREHSQGGDTGSNPVGTPVSHPATGLLVGSPCSTARSGLGPLSPPSPPAFAGTPRFLALDEIGLAFASGTRRDSMGSEWGLGRLRIGSTTADVSAIHWFAASRLRRRGQSRHPAVGSG